MLSGRNRNRPGLGQELVSSWASHWSRRQAEAVQHLTARVCVCAAARARPSVVPPQEPFTITPHFTNNATTFKFELEVVVDQALLIEKTFPEFLPPQVGWGCVRCTAVQACRCALHMGTYSRRAVYVCPMYALHPMGTGVYTYERDAVAQ